MANTITVIVTSGISSDGFILDVFDDSGKLIERANFGYGYNASYRKDIATDKAPYARDIIPSYCERYQAESVEVKPGENVFLGGQARTEDVLRFKRDYID